MIPFCCVANTQSKQQTMNVSLYDDLFTVNMFMCDAQSKQAMEMDCVNDVPKWPFAKRRNV